MTALYKTENKITRPTTFKLSKLYLSKYSCCIKIQVVGRVTKIKKS